MTVDPNPLDPYINLRERFRELAAAEGLKLVDAQILFDEGGVLRVAVQPIPEAETDPDKPGSVGDEAFEAQFAALVEGFNDEVTEEAKAKSAEEVRELRRRMKGGGGLL